MAAAAMLEYSSECYKMGSYHLDFDANWFTQTEKSLPSSEITETEAEVKFQDGRRHHFWKFKVNAVKGDNHHTTLMQIWYTD
jgi:hypothetical protein